MAIFTENDKVKKEGGPRVRMLTEPAKALQGEKNKEEASMLVKSRSLRMLGKAAPPKPTGNDKLLLGQSYRKLTS